MAKPFKGMSLFTYAGERKYLSRSERARFLDAISILDNLKHQTFCELIFWTGCRPSEALNLCAVNVDFSEGMIVFRSLKKRGALKNRHFRAVPVPTCLLGRLDSVHDIRTAQEEPDQGAGVPLFVFSRTTGWRIIQTVMETAKISGARANARGLRHALGVQAAVSNVPESRIQAWLGHASLETTSVYLSAQGLEDRAIAERMWQADLVN